jgi:hypothetical protein
MHVFRGSEGDPRLRHSITAKWDHEERLLDADEIGYLSKSALRFSALLRAYGLRQCGETPMPSELDELLRRWSSDIASDKVSQEVIVATLGITFGNYLCSARDMHWIEVRDGVGVTYAVRHFRPDVYAFPIDSVRKHVGLRTSDPFVEIDKATADGISENSEQT